MAANAWRWPSFTPLEMADNHSGELLLVPSFMDWLQGLRDAYGKPIRVTSGYRTRQHQRKLTGRDTGAHVDGQAVDVAVSGPDAFDLVKLAMEAGAMGVGVFQAGPHAGRYLHLDYWDKRETQVLWSY